MYFIKCFHKFLVFCFAGKFELELLLNVGAELEEQNKDSKSSHDLYAIGLLVLKVLFDSLNASYAVM